MKNVLWNVFFFNSVFHDFLEVTHFVHSLFVFGHVAICDEDLFVQESLLSSKLLERIRNAVIAVTDDRDAEVIFGESVLLSNSLALLLIAGLRVCTHSLSLCLLVKPGVLGAEAIVVVNYSSQRRLQLFFVLIVHRDADCESWIPLALNTASADIRQETPILDLAWLAIGAEATASHLRVELRLRQLHRLVGGRRPGFPIDFLDSLSCVGRVLVHLVVIHVIIVFFIA